MSRNRFLILALALAAAFTPAFGQEAAETAEPEGTEPTQDRQPVEWGVYVGFVPGGLVSEATIYPREVPGTKDRTRGGGYQAEIDDIKEIGGIIATNLGKRIWAQARVAIGESTYFDVPKGEVDTMVYSIDIAFIPRWRWGFYELGVPFGLGWAQSDADDVLAEGDLPGASYTLPLKSGGGMTYFLGVSNAFYIAEDWAITLDIRGKRYHRLVSVTEKALRTEEITLGIVNRF